jgi:hypothetical protein
LLFVDEALCSSAAEKRDYAAFCLTRQLFSYFTQRCNISYYQLNVLISLMFLALQKQEANYSKPTPKPARGFLMAGRILLPVVITPTLHAIHAKGNLVKHLLKHLISITLAALLTWAFIAALGPVVGAVSRFWFKLDAGQQATAKVVLPLLCGVPALIILFRRRKAAE